MSLARKCRKYLIDCGVDFEILEHRRTGNSSMTAEAAHIPGDRLAKGVVLYHDGGYILAVLPSTHKLELGALSRTLGRKVGLATESEVAEIFADCALGAVPPTGPAYELETVVDEELDSLPDVYFESGDHRTLVHVTGEGFRRMMGNAQHAHFSHHI